MVEMIFLFLKKQHNCVENKKKLNWR